MGVKAMAFDCKVTPNGMKINKPVAVKLQDIG